MINTDISLICQFKLMYYDGLISALSQCMEDLFDVFNLKIKRIHVSTDIKGWTPSYKYYQTFINLDYFYKIAFQSDFNKSDFEPRTRLYTKIDNWGVKGTQFVKPTELVKFTVVVSDPMLLEDMYVTYKSIISALSKIAVTNLTGYSFLFPNDYGPISFSSGILRKLNMPDSLVNLAQWYNSDFSKLTIGLYNCLSIVSNEQLSFLHNTFGEKNVETVRGVTIFKNESLNKLYFDDYFISSEYNCLCDEFEKYFPLVRNRYLPFNNQLSKMSLWHENDIK